jgi:hypothetical protein
MGRMSLGWGMRQLFHKPAFVCGNEPAAACAEQGHLIPAWLPVNDDIRQSGIRESHHRSLTGQAKVCPQAGTVSISFACRRLGRI